MSKNIQSVADLKTQIALITEEKSKQELRLKNHVRDFTNSLKPANLIKNAFSSINSDPEIKSTLKIKGAEAAIAFIVTQLLFKNSNPIFRVAATVLGTSFAGKIFGADASKYIDRIKSVYNKFRNKNKEEGSDLFNEEDIYTG